MPIKKTPNAINIRELGDGEVLSFFTTSRKNHFDSEAKLHETLELAVKRLSDVFSCHLSVYPYIAVHVTCGNVKLLKSKRSDLLAEIQESMESHLKQT